ncbi:hypothetical protein [Bacillus chungangensis]|uniref:Transposase n=1 Tax=Bacillus chungangensis TaxID=587633 RepID=A0ABT9WWM1_9BACI|nr:hypothetical protein [Bacillus chungangensis]MDQ0177700.1 hypothetical protein [Bacillus chungangensis]
MSNRYYSQEFKYEVITAYKGADLTNSELYANIKYPICFAGEV